MKNKFNAIIIICIMILGIVFVSDKINIKSITTDSGFDTDYDGGSYGGYEWDSGRSYNYDDNRESSVPENTPENNFIAGVFLVVFCLVIIYTLFLKKSNNNTRNTTSVNGMPKTPEVQAILNEAYDIFLETQKAWMNFDYDRLSQVVTDELYNTYYNQLETLKIKGEKNIMNNFNLVNIELLDKKEENGIIYYKVDLLVSFYDYIVDSNNNITRGTNSSLVYMHYNLNYISSKNSVDRCPKCGAKIVNGSTTCVYCRSHIQGVSSKMKLSSKRVINQR